MIPIHDALRRPDTHQADSQPGAITLSDVKRLFRSRLGLDLSETALGCGRMSELLQDQRFGDVCRLELRGKAQFVVQRQPCTAAALPPAHCADACGAWKAGPSSHADDEASIRVPHEVSSGPYPLEVDLFCGLAILGVCCTGIVLELQW